MTTLNAAALRTELRTAARFLSDSGLRLSSCWVLELLTSVGADADVDACGLTQSAYSLPAPLQDEDADVYALARSYLEGKEFQRAAHVLDSYYAADSSIGGSAGRAGPAAATAAAHYPPQAYFLRCYALYLDGQRRKELERAEGGNGLAVRDSSVNPSLQSLLTELQAAHAAATATASKDGSGGGGGGGGGMDALGLYMYGVVLKQSGRTQLAAAVLLQAVTAFPLLWAAWLDLASCITSRAQLAQLKLPEHWASQFFLGHAYMELQANTAALKVYGPLSAAFPSSTYLQAQVARAVYMLQRFDKAQALFEAVRTRDPYRIQDMDTYSNILFVKGDRAGMSVLAHAVQRMDRFKPQSCCVVGNYHALRGEHEAAILAFRRAIQLDAGYLEAWTLMGHEYVELRNTSAAIECYRRAVDTNSCDYRAWYGLGQTYELLSMYLYAIHYYKQAALLRPYDARMWCALGACYERLDRRPDAVAAYERAARHADREGLATIKLAKLYREVGEVAAACKWYAQHVEDRESAGLPPTPDVADALLFLAAAAKDEGRLEDAETFLNRVIGMPMPSEVRDARALLAEVRALRSRRHSSSGGGGGAGGGGSSPGRLAARIAAAQVASTPAAMSAYLGTTVSASRQQRPGSAVSRSSVAGGKPAASSAAAAASAVRAGAAAAASSMASSASRMGALQYGTPIDARMGTSGFGMMMMSPSASSLAFTPAGGGGGGGGGVPGSAAFIRGSQLLFHSAGRGVPPPSAVLPRSRAAAASASASHSHGHGTPAPGHAPAAAAAAAATATSTPAAHNASAFMHSAVEMSVLSPQSGHAFDAEMEFGGEEEYVEEYEHEMAGGPLGRGRAGAHGDEEEEEEEGGGLDSFEVDFT